MMENENTGLGKVSVFFVVMDLSPRHLPPLGGSQIPQGDDVGRGLVDWWMIVLLYEVREREQT